MRRASSTHRISLAQRIALAGLLLCVALAQSLSFAHRALHHDVRMLAYAYEEAHADQHAHAGDCHEAQGIFSRLFAGHEQGDESCRLLDASSLFLDKNKPLAQKNPAPNAHYLIALNAPWPSAWQALPFEARAPPVLSL